MNFKLMALMAACALTGVTLAARAGDIGPRAEDVRCRAFAAQIEKELLVDTSDATSEIGQWVAQQRGQGWGQASSELALVQRSSGSLQAWAHVCVRR